MVPEFEPFDLKNIVNLIFTHIQRSRTFSDSSLYIADILAATSTGAGDSKINSSVGALFDFLPHAIRLNTN